MKNPDKQRAIEEGRKFYVGSPHSCGGVIRYVINGSCQYCSVCKARVKLYDGSLDKYKSRDKDAERLRRWRENNYEKFQQQWLRDTNSIVRQAKRRAQKRDQTPELTEQEERDIIEVYNQCREMTTNTGVPHEVDHIIPISKGGLHHPDNLQILTMEENRRKGAK